MGEILRKRLKQSKFAGNDQEALLNVIIAGNYLRSKLDFACSEFDITAAQYNVLRILRGVFPDGYARCDIISRMIEQSPDVTRLIDRLITQRLVERFQSNEDRRQSIARITRKGLNLVEEVALKVGEVNKILSTILSKDEISELSLICEKIYGREV